MNPNQKIIKARRTYNKLVANEMMEDFALRFTAKRVRRWSLSRIAMAALGIVSFLVLEAIGGAITLSYGFENSAWAILAVSLIIFFTGLPISYYAAKYGVDIDLLSRGAGFGYIGSTITSLVYASFTFIFFALEAAIMSMALQILFGLPLYIGYVVSVLLVLPLVTHGMTYISRFQVWSQPIWFALQVLPLVFVFTHADADFDQWIHFTGEVGERGGTFDLLLFGAASAVLLALVAQIGEQVDLLRFLPEKSDQGNVRWWIALIAGGPGWILFGAIKLFIGSFLAFFAVQQGVAVSLASDPAHMYQLAYSYVFENKDIAIVVACLFVIISQLKINVANAYAGSLAWSNFFSRVTHTHPGRVVWMIFNLTIALLLMELGVYQTIASMLSVYSVVVLAWLSTVVADLIINKPLGISPPGIEFKRSHLYDINPVGVGSLIIASFVGFTGHLGYYGEVVKAFSSYLAFILPFFTVPLIGLITQGKFYLVPKENNINELATSCHICENTFDSEDMTFCPAYGKAICSLCCSLDVRCGDQCRPDATISKQAYHFFNRFLPRELLTSITSPLVQFIVVTLGLSLIGAATLFLIHQQVPVNEPLVKEVFAATLVKIFFVLLIIIGIISWLFILARSSNQSALKELRSQTNALAKEINAHEKTSSALQKAKDIAESANEAKSRYLAGLSHELRTPLNVMLGYAQLLSKDNDLPIEKRNNILTIKRNGEHLADLIEGLLEISKIEAGKMTLQRDEFNLKVILRQLVDMFQMQASKKGLAFNYISSPNLPDYVATDKQRFRQILINLISNAIKYTKQGSVTFKVTYRSEVADFSIIDTGAGISKSDQSLVFKPFEQIRNTETQSIAGTGLGLAISQTLAGLMGGEITLKSTLGQGSTFNFKLMLFKLNSYAKEMNHPEAEITGYIGEQLSILVVDDDFNQRNLMDDLLQPLGFNVISAEDAKQGLVLMMEHDINLVLLDVRMPEIDGWQMLKIIREQHYNIPVLMVSANARDAEFKLQAERLHNGYIAKPVNLNGLLVKISQLLSIQWQYKYNDGINASGANTVIENTKSLASAEQYEILIALAEIGFLSGFQAKFNEISEQYQYPEGVESQIKKYVEVCNFPKIIEDLSELIHEA